MFQVAASVEIDKIKNCASISSEKKYIVGLKALLCNGATIFEKVF